MGIKLTPELTSELEKYFDDESNWIVCSRCKLVASYRDDFLVHRKKDLVIAKDSGLQLIFPVIADLPFGLNRKARKLYQSLIEKRNKCESEFLSQYLGNGKFRSFPIGDEIEQRDLDNWFSEQEFEGNAYLLWSQHTVWFANENDATLFKLTWT